MAIILEEQKNQFPWFLFITLLVIIVVASFAGYYLFIVKPDLVERVLPIHLKDVADLTTMGVDVSTLQQNSAFMALQDHIPTPILREDLFGKANPFVR